MKCVISGSAMKTSVGTTKAECFSAFCAGHSGLHDLTVFDHAHFNVTRSYEIDDRTPAGSDRPRRATEWVVEVVRAALAEAQVDADESRVAILVGTGLRELRSVELWWADGAPLSPADLDFGHALRSETGWRSPCVTLANACSASNFALGLAQDLLELGDADAVVVAGVDSINESMFGLLDRVNGDKPDAVRPLDRDRRGVIIGEGAAAVVLEPMERAVARGVAPLAFLRSVGMSCDAFHETAPDVAGICRAMHDAHSRAGISPQAVDLLMVHGTGTPLNDKAETAAVLEVFGEAAGKPHVTALKSLTGHTSGASGLVAVVTAVECLRRGEIPPTVGLRQPMPEAEGLNIVVDTARDGLSLSVAQVNAFGFGGVNAVAVLERYES